MKLLAFFTAIIFLLLPFEALALTPTILDTLPVTLQSASASLTLSFTYTVPSGGVNQLEVVHFIGTSGNTLTSVTQNGVTMKSYYVQGGCSPAREQASPFYAILANPTSGTLTITMASAVNIAAYVVTLQDASANVTADAIGCGGKLNTNPYAQSTTTASGNTLLLDFADNSNGSVNHTFTHPGGQTNVVSQTLANGLNFIASDIVGSTTAKSVTMSESLDGASNDGDITVLAIALATTTPAAATTNRGSEKWFFFMQ